MGLGIAINLVMLCPNHHRQAHSGKNGKNIQALVKSYLESIYGVIDDKKRKFNKWEYLNYKK